MYKNYKTANHLQQAKTLISCCAENESFHASFYYTVI